MSITHPVIKTAITARFALFAFCLAVNSRADVLAKYSFGNTRASTTTNANAVLTTFADGSGFAGYTSYDSTQGKPTDGAVPVLKRTNIESGNFTDAQNNAAGCYWEFSIMAKPGYKISLANLTFGIKRASSSTANVTLLTSVDGFASSVGAIGYSTSWQVSTIDLSGPAYGKLDSIAIRVVPYGVNGRAGNNWIDDVTLNGVVAAPPGSVILVR